jgi:hypothetical protein
MEDIMRSNLIRLVLGCGLAAAFAAPTVACEFNKTAQSDQTVAQSQQTPDTPQTAESQPAADTSSN